MGHPFLGFGINYSYLNLVVYFQRGIKTVVWTDTLQTFFMLLAVFVSIVLVSKELGLSGIGEMMVKVSEQPYSKIFNWDWKSGTNFLSSFFWDVYCHSYDGIGSGYDAEKPDM